MRDWKGKDPLRIVIDKDLSLDTNLNLFDKTVNTICFNSIKNEKVENLSYIKINLENLEDEILNVLYQHKIQSIIIEGGSKTIQKFVDKNLWDEAHVFVGNQHFKDGIKAPKLQQLPVEEIKVLDDILKIYKNV